MKQTACLLISVALLSSCATRSQLTYFRDAQAGSEVAVAAPRLITLEPGNDVNIFVNSRDEKLAQLFNVGVSSIETSDEGRVVMVCHEKPRYTLDGGGYIDFPVLGQLKLDGLTRDSVAKLIKRKLVEGRMLTDAVVNVKFCDLYVNVLGEVAHPGRIAIEGDSFTLIDALGLSGDLTANGDRRCIVVLRKEGNTRRTYHVNLNSADDVYSSPAFFLKQGDVVYVKPRRAHK